MDDSEPSAGHANGGPTNQPDPIELAHEAPFRIGPLTIEPALRRIEHDDKREEIIEPRVMQVLVAFARAGDGILSRDDLIHCCWDDRAVSDDAINRVISKLRKLASDLGEDSFSIETITKIGYRLVSDANHLAVEVAAGSGTGAEGSIGRDQRRWRTAALALLLLIAASATVLFASGWFSVAEAEREPSLTVLPFADMSPAGDNEYFAQGMAEEIIGLLSDEPGLRVTGRTSAAMLGADASFDKARRLLGATHLLEGSVRTYGDDLRVNVRLLETRDGTQLWSQNFDRRRDDVFAIQDEIGAAVASRLRGTFWPAAAPEGIAPTSFEVYDLYLRSASLARSREYELIVQATKLLERAIEIDPEYAPAYARLAYFTALAEMVNPAGYGSGPGEKLPEIRGYVRRALALAPNLAEAYAALAVMHTDEPRRALAYFRKTVELDPNNYLGWNGSGVILLDLMCRPRDAIPFFQRAVELEPLVRAPNINVASALLAIGQHRQADMALNRYIRRIDNPALISGEQGRHPWQRGDLAAAIGHYREAARLGSTDPTVLDEMAQAYQALGMTDEAVQALPSKMRGVIGNYWFGEYRKAAAAMLEESEPWDGSWRARIGMNALLRAGMSDRVVSLFDERFASAEAFDQWSGCELVYNAPPVILAFRQQGRDADAAKLLRLAEKRYRQAREGGYARSEWDAGHAAIQLLGGRSAAALVSLQRALDGGWLGDSENHISLADPVFDALRNDPRFKTIERKRRARIAEERTKLAKQSVA